MLEEKSRLLLSRTYLARPESLASNQSNVDRSSSQNVFAKQELA
jgi:hypothetical protein